MVVYNICDQSKRLLNPIIIKSTTNNNYTKNQAHVQPTADTRQTCVLKVNTWPIPSYM